MHKHLTQFITLIFLCTISRICTAPLTRRSVLAQTFMKEKVNTKADLNEWFLIQNKATGKCLRAVRANHQLELTACIHFDETAWKKVSQDGGTIGFKNRAGNWFIDNFANGQLNDNRIMSWDFIPNSITQKFTLASHNAQNYNSIKASGSQKCLHVPTKNIGALIVQRDCNSNEELQAFILVPFLGPQRTVGLPSARWVNLKNKQNGDCLTHDDQNRPVKGFPCTNGDRSLWRFDFNAVEGSYFITSKVGQFLLDNFANGFADGVIQHSWDRHGSIQQNYQPVPHEDPAYFRLVIKGTNKCVSSNGVSNDGSSIIQSPCATNDPSQAWKIEERDEIRPTEGVPLNSWVRILTANNMCIKFQAANTRMIQVACGDGDEFLWSLSWNGAIGQYFIISKKGNFFFDNFARLKHDGNPTVSWTAHGDKQQNWRIEPSNAYPGKFVFIAYDSYKCMSLDHSASGAQTLQKTCSNDSTQAYSFEVKQEIEKPVVDHSHRWVQIVNEGTGKCVRVNAVNLQMIIAECNNSDEFVFNISYRPSKTTYFIQSKFPALYWDNAAKLTHNGNHILSYVKHGDTQQDFGIKSLGDNRVVFVTDRSKCVSVDPGKTDTLTGLVQWDCQDGNPDQIFVIKKWYYQQNPAEGIPQDNWVQIVNKESGDCVRAKGVNIPLAQEPCADDPEFFFNLSWYSRQGTFYIANAKFQNTFFDQFAKIKTDGNKIHSWVKHGDTQQDFFITPHEFAGYFRFTSRDSSKCVTVNSNPKDVQNFFCTKENGNQAFKFIPVYAPPVPPPQPQAQFTIRGYVRNAQNNQIIPQSELTSGNAKITFTDSNNNSYTATISNGIYEVVLPAGNYTRAISLDGYISSHSNFNVTQSLAESDFITQILVSKILQGAYRIVLTWKDKPADIDSYIETPSSEYVSYNIRESSDGKVKLDVDDRDGHGPETITIQENSNGAHKYFVHNYSNEALLSTSGAHVVVYHGSDQIKDFDVPTTGTGRIWNVFTFNPATQTFTTVNTLS